MRVPGALKGGSLESVYEYLPLRAGPTPITAELRRIRE
jgi:hypothetical protein